GIEQGEHSTERDGDPVRSIGQLISDLVKRLLQHEETHYLLRRGSVGWAEGSPSGDVEIAIEIGTRCPGLPGNQALPRSAARLARRSANGRSGSPSKSTITASFPATSTWPR